MTNIFINGEKISPQDLAKTHSAKLAFFSEVGVFIYSTHRGVEIESVNEFISKHPDKLIS